MSNESHGNFNFIASSSLVGKKLVPPRSFRGVQGQKIEGKLKRFLRVLAESMGDLRGESKKRARYKGGGGRETEKRKAGRERSIR